ncbi:transcription elongation factor TFIIS, partial [Cryomyces antarcticus]
MDAKDIEELGKALSKAIVGGDSPASLLSLLEKLRKGVKITEKLLRQTKIGMTVNKLKQHKDPAVARQAGDLVSKWRTDINNAKSAA